MKHFIPCPSPNSLEKPDQFGSKKFHSLPQLFIFLIVYSFTGTILTIPRHTPFYSPKQNEDCCRVCRLFLSSTRQVMQQKPRQLRYIAQFFQRGSIILPGNMYGCKRPLLVFLFWQERKTWPMIAGNNDDLV